MKLHQLLGLTPSKESEPIATGFKELDRLTGGLPIGTLTTIAARPGMGKTSLAVSLMRNIGVIQKVPTAFLSLQLNEMQIVKWLKATITGYWEDVPEEQRMWTPPEAIVKEFANIGFHIEPERKTDSDAVKMMKEAPVWIEHDLDVSVKEIVSRMERLHQENKVRVFFLDGWEWVRVTGNYPEQKQSASQLCEAAERLKVALVLTSVLNRSVETRGGSKRPELRDLNNSFGLETYSSMVMFVYRPEYYMIDRFEDETPSKGLADIMVERNTYGSTGNVRLCFENYCNFREMHYGYNFKEGNDEEGAAAPDLPF